MSNQGPLFNFRRSENNYEYGTHIWAIVSGSLYLRPLIKEPYGEAQSYYLPVLSNTAWVYAGFTYDFQTGMVKLWVNGVEAGQLQNTPQLNLITDTPVRMGARHSSAADTRYFSGAIKCVQWYGTVLSAEQIQQTVELCREPIYGAQLKVHQGYVMGIDASLTYRTEHDVHSLTECAALCCRDCSCLSVNFLETTATCELSKYSNVYNSSLELTRRSDREVYAELLHPGNKLYH
ncbi:uncharacterized protein LOC106153009 [Lingula anatina]|uniref:Uncharacterized protein LOC106153009 n=1 Tax=Lingula anatina TaxID=7574 RepID=A0A1S3H9T3_LINAN|nr:uncharacterized protein LOC106153009 [Lingula anatina]|eukprot:XP_013382226.1 uncharacterized protein LOC106153009 [Lingula anatina]